MAILILCQKLLLFYSKMIRSLLDECEFLQCSDKNDQCHYDVNPKQWEHFCYYNYFVDHFETEQIWDRSNFGFNWYIFFVTIQFFCVFYSFVLKKKEFWSDLSIGNGKLIFCESW